MALRNSWKKTKGKEKYGQKGAVHGELGDILVVLYNETDELSRPVRSLVQLNVPTLSYPSPQQRANCCLHLGARMPVTVDRIAVRDSTLPARPIEGVDPPERRDMWLACYTGIQLDPNPNLAGWL